MVSDKNMNKKRLINLNYLNILEIVGEGAIELLQGQLTCDMGKVSSKNPTQGAICNVKGRIISSFIVVAPNDENTNKFWLIGPELMMKKTQDVLKKYSPFYQVDISILSDKDLYGANNDALESFFPDLNFNDNQYIRHSSLVLGYLDKKIRLVITNKGDTVFDPFLGTGTSAVVSKKLGREYCGIEKDKKYFNAAEDRISKAEKIKDDYLDTIENNKSKPRIPFGSLVELGIIKPGTSLMDPKKKINAKIMADGSIKYKESEGSIHKVAAKIMGTESCNGWTYWHCDINGSAVLIDSLRQKFISSKQI